MRKGAGLVISGTVLLIPPVLALGVLTVMSTRFGSKLLVDGLARVGVRDFGMYVDPVVVSITGASGLILLLIGLRRMRAQGLKPRTISGVERHG